MQKNKLKSLIHFHFIVFVFGFTAILGSLISVDSLKLVWYRMLIATLSLLFLAPLFKKKLNISLHILFKLFFCGLIISLHWFFFFKAIKVSNVSITLSILSLGAFMTSFLEPIIYKRKIILYEVILGLLVVLGTAIIFKTQFHYFEGILYALGSVILSVFFTLFNGKLIEKMSSFTISFYELLGGFLTVSVLLIISNDFDSDLFVLKRDDLIWLFILGTICTAYAFVISVEVMKHLSPFSVMLSINMEPIYGIVLAIIFLSESENMSYEFYIGFLLIFISVILNGIMKLLNK
jgi:drug/metabolite transporter (DMT)-like permease|tara:strand:- start:1505 stop:2380 length:876 start_codon:yes stop_codon:yes gene_type:complete